MIISKEDLELYLEADRIALGLPLRYGMMASLKAILFPNYIHRFQRTLRKLEYYKNCKSGPWALWNRFFLTRKYNRLSLKLGFSIPPNVFGPGLSIAHFGTVIVNGSAKVGANCRLHACVNIGTEAGSADSAPTIGDNCYIGPGAKIYGAIHIPDGVAVGANAVVNRSCEANIAIAGVPAKMIGAVDTLVLVIPATQIVKLGLNRRADISGLSARELKVLLQGDARIYGEIR